MEKKVGKTIIDNGSSFSVILKKFVEAINEN